MPAIFEPEESQFKLFEEQDKIKSFDNIDSMLIPPGYTFPKYDDHFVFYHLVTNVLNVPEVTTCVPVDQYLHVKLFYEASTLPLPQCFPHRRNCRLTRKSMNQNYPNYIKLEGEQTLNILEVLKELRFKKKKYSCPVLFDIHFFYVILPYKYPDY